LAAFFIVSSFSTTSKKMGVSSEEKIIQGLQNQVEKVAFFCSAEDASPDLAVHEIRKSFKRIVAFLKMFPGVFAEPISEQSKQLKVIARLLTEARESAVNLMLFDRIMEVQSELTSEKTERIKTQLEKENREQIDLLFVQNHILEKIAGLIEQLKALLLPLLAGKEIEVSDRLMLSYQKSFSLYSQLQGSYDPLQFHELRKLLKTLWYQFDVLTADQEATFFADSAELDKLTEMLGEDHDWYIFQQELQKETFPLEDEDKNILEKQIRDFRDSNFTQLEPGLEDFFLNPDKNFIEKLNRIQH